MHTLKKPKIILDSFHYHKAKNWFIKCIHIWIS